MNNDSHVTINITYGAIWKTIWVLLLVYLMYQVRDVILVVILAVVIASAVEPGTKWLVRHKIPRIVSAFLLYFLIIVIIFGILYFLVPPLLGESVSLINNIPQYIKIAEIWPPIKEITPIIQIQTVIPVSAIASGLTSTVSSFLGDPFQTAGTVLNGVVSLGLTVVISFYMVVREDGVEQFLKLVVPIKNEEYVIDLWKRTQRKIGRWMQGQLLLQLIVSVLIYFGLIILRVPHPLLLAIFGFIFELIPVFGMSLAAIPAVLLAVLNGGLSLGLLVVGLYLIIQQFESNIIYPLVVKKVVGIPPLLVIIALVVGGELAGLIGIILSVPISVALTEYIDDIGMKRREARVRHNS